MYVTSLVFSVVALGLGAGGISWAPMVFIGTCLSIYFVYLWQSGYFAEKKEYGGFYVLSALYAAVPVACAVALLVPTLALGESDSSGTTVVSLLAFVLAFWGGLNLEHNRARERSSQQASGGEVDSSDSPAILNNSP